MQARGKPAWPPAGLVADGHRTTRDVENGMSKPRLLDLFCGAGGAGAGYACAGFEVVGVDIEPQPRYPFAFHQADALEVLERLCDGGPLFRTAAAGLDAIHVSPPCQHASRLGALWPDREYPEMIERTRELLIGTDLPYVIENVEGAALMDPITLCGSTFGLGVRRHRLFESNVELRNAGPCRHAEQGPVLSVQGHAGGQSRRDGLRGRGTTQEWREAMGIDWMTGVELAQSIPPVYTQHIGHYLLAEVEARAGRLATWKATK